MDTLKSSIGDEQCRHRMALSVAEAAIELGVGRDHIYTAIKSGLLDARKLGRRTIITYDAVVRFLNNLPLLELRSADASDDAA